MNLLKITKKFVSIFISKLTLGKFAIVNRNKVPINPMLNSLKQSELNSILDKNLTMTSARNLLFTASVCDAVIRNNIEGDFVEVGVWRGGHLIAANVGFGESENRKIIGIDTFSGMTDPDEGEFNLNSGKSAISRTQELKSGKGWIPASVEEVRSNCIESGLTPDRFELHKVDMSNNAALVEKKLPTNVSVLRVDVDWKNPTANTLEVFYKLVVPGGIVIIDDYGSWSGAKEAVDDFRKKNLITDPLFQIDGGAFYWTKSK